MTSMRKWTVAVAGLLLVFGTAARAEATTLRKGGKCSI
jgi:hypothetical protein